MSKFEHSIIFITPSSSQPRYIKRAQQLAEFCNLTIFSFKRGYYENNTYPSQMSYVNLGLISDGKYFQRVFQIIPAVLKIRRHIKGRKKCFFYALSFDCLVIAKLCGMKQGFYEVGDLISTKGLGKFFGYIEGLLMKNILGLVVTSRSFYEDFFKQKDIVPESLVYIIDNKLDQSMGHRRVLNKHFIENRVVIGLIGFLRYQRPIKLVLDFVKQRSSTHCLVCFGDGPLRELVESYSCENIAYYGTFRSPEDLQSIYSGIDLNYVIYDNASQNVRLAIPNKLFESVFFGVPIVCAKNTSVGKIVREWGVGKMIRTDNMSNFEEDMKSINEDFLRSSFINCTKIPNEQLIDNGSTVLECMLKDSFIQERA